MKTGKEQELIESKNVASLAETREAIKNLSKADYAKLMFIAKFFAWTRIRNTIVQPEDLLHNAILKTLDGRRRWNKIVGIIKHFDRVMESEAGHITEKSVLHSPDPLIEDPDELPNLISDPEKLVTARDEAKHLIDFFEGDEVALRLLHLKGDGLSAAEIQNELGMDKKQYDTILKRIRRRLVKRLSEQGSQL